MTVSDGTGGSTGQDAGDSAATSGTASRAGGLEDGPEEDRRLLAAAADGDAAAFGVLVARHRDRLWAVAVRTLGDREEAADALQDGLLSAFRAAGSFRGEAQVTTWLHRIVVNACLDRARRARTRPTVPLPESGREPADPHDALGQSETALDLRAALAGLPEEQRAAIVLVDVAGLPVDEAARALGVAPGTVKSRCSRGRARLALTLGHLRNRPAPGAVPPQRADRRTTGTGGEA